MTQDEATQHVMVGAGLLDQHYPGWARRIDIGTLRLASADHCICGQLGNGHNWATLPKSLQLAIVSLEHGFQSAGFVAQDGDYPLLQDAWIAAIADRLILHESPVPIPVQYVPTPVLVPVRNP